jgi:hypothetical protein
LFVRQIQPSSAKRAPYHGASISDAFVDSLIDTVFQGLERRQSKRASS